MVVLVAVVPAIVGTGGTVATIPIILIPVSPVTVAAISSVGVTATLKINQVFIINWLIFKNNITPILLKKLILKFTFLVLSTGSVIIKLILADFQYLIFFIQFQNLKT